MSCLTKKWTKYSIVIFGRRRQMHHPLLVYNTLLQCFNCENGWWYPLLVYIYMFTASPDDPTCIRSSMDESISVWHILLLVLYIRATWCSCDVTRCKTFLHPTNPAPPVSQCKILAGFPWVRIENAKKEEQTAAETKRYPDRFRNVWPSRLLVVGGSPD
jgi:hypothetical protein